MAIKYMASIDNGCDLLVSNFIDHHSSNRNEHNQLVT